MFLIFRPSRFRRKFSWKIFAKQLRFSVSLLYSLLLFLREINLGRKYINLDCSDNGQLHLSLKSFGIKFFDIIFYLLFIL